MKDLFAKLSAVEDAPQYDNGNLAESFAGKKITKTPASTGVVADPLIKNILSKFSNLTGEANQRPLMENAAPTRQLAMPNALSLDEIKSLYLKYGNGAAPESKEKLKILCQMAMAYLASSKRGE